MSNVITGYMVAPLTLDELESMARRDDLSPEDVDDWLVGFMDITMFLFSQKLG